MKASLGLKEEDEPDGETLALAKVFFFIQYIK